MFSLPAGGAGSVSFSEINKSSVADLLWTSTVKFLPAKINKSSKLLGDRAGYCGDNSIGNRRMKQICQGSTFF